LLAYGWDASFQRDLDHLEAPDLEPARVTEEQRDGFRVRLRDGQAPARPSGRLRHETPDPLGLPAVGDWALVRRAPGAGPHVIAGVLPRRSALVRKAAGKASDGQVVAANVDVVLLVVSLNADFEPRRVERWLALVWESGATPVVLLNKADLHPDPDGAREEVEAVAIGVPVHAVSALTGDGLGPLAAHLRPGRTALLVGSSGVGKSTIVNRLLGAEVQRVEAIRASDDRGCHTTTARRLLALPGGALLVDTPGMREVGLFDAEDGLEEAFGDVQALARTCRFTDCAHETEPGCAVQDAVEDGSLDRARLASWRKLQREAMRQAAKDDVRVRRRLHEEHRRRTRAIRRQTEEDRRRKGR
jgi:ribosome biogenesis GTPase